VEEIGYDNLPKLIRKNSKFLETVNDNWLIDFYSYLYVKVRSLLGKNGDLATIPFIKTSDGDFNAPYKINMKGKIEQNIFIKMTIKAAGTTLFSFLSIRSPTNL